MKMSLHRIVTKSFSYPILKELREIKKIIRETNKIANSRYKN